MGHLTTDTPIQFTRVEGTSRTALCWCLTSRDARPSPYTPGEIAREVPGRAEQLTHIDERLSYLTGMQRLVGRIRVDHGPRGLGKTSLLRKAQRDATKLGCATVWVTAGESAGLVPAIAEEIQRLTRDWGHADTTRKVRTALDHLEVKVAGGVPGVASVEATWRGHGTPAPPPAPTATTRQFEDLILAAVDAAREQGHSGLVLFVDEVQAADPDGLRTLSYAWQHFQSEQPNLPAALFAAGLPESVTVINTAVSNSERFAYHALGDLPRDAALIALAGPARGAGVTWDQDAIERAVDYAGGYPHTIQLVGDSAWRAAGLPDPGAVITLPDLHTALRAVQADLEQLYTARLSKVTAPNDVRLVNALASLGDGPVKRADLAAALGMKTDDLGIPRARLIGAGIISDAGYGHIAFTIPGFAKYIRQSAGLPEARPPPAPSPRSAGAQHDRRVPPD